MFIHVEEKGGGTWGQYKTQREADALEASQHPRGKRGALLRRSLLQVKTLTYRVSCFCRSAAFEG